MRRIWFFCVVCLILFLATAPAFAGEQQAEKIRDDFEMTLSDGRGTPQLSDGLQTTYFTLLENVSL